MTSTDLDVLEQAQRITRMGKIYARSLQRDCLGKKQQWLWNVTRRRDLETLIPLIKPWLGRRRKEQLALLEKSLKMVRRNRAECGTPGGYHRHRYAGESPCDACYIAQSAYAHQQYLKRRGV